MKYRYLIFALAGYLSCSQAQTGCGTLYTPPCQVQLRSQTYTPQQINNMYESFDPQGQFRQGQMESQKYDVEQQQLDLQQQELAIKRLELQKRMQQLQQQ